MNEQTPGTTVPAALYAYATVYIYKFRGGYPALIMRTLFGKSETALNWRELKEEAMLSIEPEGRRRWQSYWEQVSSHAQVMRHAVTADELMETIPVPSANYSCPPELAARAIFPTSLPELFVLPEAKPAGKEPQAS